MGDSLQALRKQCGLQGTRGNLVLHNLVASDGSNIESLTPANLFWAYLSTAQFGRKIINPMCTPRFKTWLHHTSCNIQMTSSIKIDSIDKLRKLTQDEQSRDKGLGKNSTVDWLRQASSKKKKKGWGEPVRPGCADSLKVIRLRTTSGPRSFCGKHVVHLSFEEITIIFQYVLIWGLFYYK